MTTTPQDDLDKQIDELFEFHECTAVVDNTNVDCAVCYERKKRIKTLIHASNKQARIDEVSKATDLNLYTSKTVGKANKRLKEYGERRIATLKGDNK